MLFDDSWPHSVVNTSDELRAVLIVDVRRPLPLVADLVNRLLVDRDRASYLRALARAQGRSVRQRADALTSRRLIRRVCRFVSAATERSLRSGCRSRCAPIALATAAGAPLAGSLISHRLKRGKEHPARLAERRGESAVARPDGPLVWLHGASVGEIAAIVPLVERIVAQGFNVLVTSGTVTSAKLAEQRLPAGRHPSVRAVRFAAVRRRFLKHWKPDLVLFTESDLWPNLIMMSVGARAFR